VSNHAGTADAEQGKPGLLHLVFAFSVLTWRV